jgi:hypothetical protein
MHWIRYLVSGLLALVTLIGVLFLMSRVSTPQREEQLILRSLQLISPSEVDLPERELPRRPPELAPEPEPEAELESGR